VPTNKGLNIAGFSATLKASAWTQTFDNPPSLETHNVEGPSGAQEDTPRDEQVYWWCQRFAVDKITSEIRTNHASDGCSEVGDAGTAITTGGRIMTDANADPQLFIRACVLPSVSSDPEVEPTPNQLELLERYRLELARALYQHQPEFGRRILESDDRDCHRGRRLILKVQRAMLSIRPHKLRALINDVTNELWKEFESNWKRWRWKQREAEERDYCQSAAGKSRARRWK
jgi:hypothetical protein